LLTAALVSVLGCTEPAADGPSGSVAGSDGPAATSADTASPSPTGSGTVTYTFDDGVSVTDLAMASGFADAGLSGFQRGRANVAADFDGDGDIDHFLGNPGDTSFLLMNVSEGGALRYEAGQQLDDGLVMWGGVAADLDNDGDQDLVVGVGGNETNFPGFDRVYLNDGSGTLDDVSRSSGLVFTDLEGEVVAGYTASVIAWDADLDGILDLFLNRPVNPSSWLPLHDDTPMGRNGLFRGLGDGTFEQVQLEPGWRHRWSTRNSAVLDYDNDGDLDLFENNAVGPNILWRNDRVETGVLGFTDVTAELSLGGADLSYPQLDKSQAAIASDLNQDGFEDLVVFRRGEREPGEPAVHSGGHLVWINVAGRGFVEVADATGINVDFPYPRSHAEPLGVMGCQLGDLNADGIADVYVGNGGIAEGWPDSLLVSTGITAVGVDHPDLPPDLEVRVPRYESWSHRVDYPSGTDALRHDAEVRYPYRTHGISFADADGDGLYEVLVSNGGPAYAGPEVAEPNRVFQFRFPRPGHWLRVRLEGGGGVSRDAIGARVRARVRDADGTVRTVHGTRRAATGFAAQNDPDVFLGLGEARDVLQLEVVWPDGHVQRVPTPSPDSWVDVKR